MTEASAAGAPAGIRRFNWGAFFFPVIWPLVYGIPGWALVAFLSSLILQFLGVGLPEEVPARTLLLLNVFALAVEMGVRLYFGFNVTAAYWARHPDRMTPEDYRRRQGKWVAWGILAMTFSVLLNVYLIGSALR